MAMRYFATYTDVPYPLQKLDIVAIPDFQASAMENWGLILVREDRILYDWTPDNKTFAGNDTAQNSYHMLKISAFICEEVGHQWFGNLVTQEWWTDIWVSEGLATFFAYLAMESMFPKTEIGECHPVT